MDNIRNEMRWKSIYRNNRTKNDGLFFFALSLQFAIHFDVEGLVMVTGEIVTVPKGDRIIGTIIISGKVFLDRANCR